jgi:AraC-like DNA-binding protein
VTYREYPTVVPEVVLWRSAVGAAPKPKLILPDGCLDLIWDGRQLTVAGPDTIARWHQAAAGASTTALRFYGGIGPGLLGVPADELRDRTVDFEDLFGSAEARTMVEQVAADPVGRLTAWLDDRLGRTEWVEGTTPSRPDALGPDALGPRVFTLASAGLSVDAMADRVGLSVRQLHRRCQPLFGYGPRHLARVLRLMRAVDRAGAGRPLAQVAADCGYCDQAHLSREVRALAGTTPTRLLAELAY